MRFVSLCYNRACLALLPLVVAAAVGVGCEERSGEIEYRDETNPIPWSEFRPSSGVEFEAFATLPDATHGDLEVRLVVENPGPDTLRYEHGDCFFIVRAYPTENPETRPDWDHRGTVEPSSCTLELAIGTVEPLGADTVDLIPEMSRGYDRRLPEDPGSLWVILNLEGRPHLVPVAIGGR